MLVINKIILKKKKDFTVLNLLQETMSTCSSVIAQSSVDTRRSSKKLQLRALGEVTTTFA